MNMCDSSDFANKIIGFCRVIRVLALFAALVTACSGREGPQQAQLRTQQVSRFSPAMAESSGLAWHDGSFWTMNDSGDEALLYRLDEEGTRLATVRVSNARNVDWESLAQDEEFLYVADTGNNFNIRGSFTIYRIAWPALAAESVEADSITFSYADRRRGWPRSHNFDAEGLTVRGDELWLFSKNRGDGHTRLYRFPKTPGHYEVEPSQTLEVASLITAADIHPLTGDLALVSSRRVGNGREQYLWHAPTTESGVDWSRMRSVQFGPNDQWEAVLWDGSGDNLYFTHENGRRGYAGLARLSIRTLDQGANTD